MRRDADDEPLRRPMTTAFVILLIALGVAAAGLMPRAPRLARALWPGPTVKGPADLYAQAFQALLCLAVLFAVVVLASIGAFVLSVRSGWTPGLWLSALPLVYVGALLAWLSLRRA